MPGMSTYVLSRRWKPGKRDGFEVVIWYDRNGVISVCPEFLSSRVPLRLPEFLSVFLSEFLSPSSSHEFLNKKKRSLMES